MSQPNAEAREFDAIAIGDTAALERVIEEKDVAAFAALTGDYNPLHTNAVFAFNTRFKARVAHGMLIASLLSTLVGMHLPGRDALLLSQSLEFRQPVYLGDRITVRVRVAHKVASMRVLQLECIATNQRNEVVMAGTAHVMVN